MVSWKEKIYAKGKGNEMRNDRQCQCTLRFIKNAHNLRIYILMGDCIPKKPDRSLLLDNQTSVWPLGYVASMKIPKAQNVSFAYEQ